MQKITPFLWFDNQAEDAMNFYVSIFKNSKVGTISRYGDAGPGPKGSVMVASFELDGMQFTALNGGPHFKFTEAISLYVNCETQDEVDYFWNKLTAGGGQPSQCGWLKDKYGLSWQIVPSALPRLLSDPDGARANRVMQAMMQMQKIDVAKLEQAAKG
jgi:predicted 3-demethylubiquinone-9 3-methyltransferase (glyoxalase superfamily)